jgi:hypothetical protein
MTEENKNAANIQPAPKKGGKEVYGILMEYIDQIDKSNINNGKYAISESLKNKLNQRYEFGKKKYGQALMTEDGRDVIRDFEEELLDAIYYLAKAIYTKETTESLNNSKEMLILINDLQSLHQQQS